MILSPTPPAAAPLTLPANPARRRLLASSLAFPAVLSLALVAAETARANQKRSPRPFNARVIQSGHSLTDPIVPELKAVVRSIGGASQTQGMKMDRSTIPGSPMEWRWNNRNRYMPDARYDISDYEVLVLTERVPLSNTLPWHASEEMALRYFNNAWSKGSSGKGAETILYASWIEVDSGPGAPNPYNDPQRNIPFRKRLDNEIIYWEKIVDYVNAARPKGSPAMTMIPGPLIMAALYDAIKSRKAPGISRIEDIFSDTIHINKIGAMLIALAHYAVIYQRDPREVSSRLVAASVGSVDTGEWMKAMVWNVVSKYPRSGFD